MEHEKPHASIWYRLFGLRVTLSDKIAWLLESQSGAVHVRRVAAADYYEIGCDRFVTSYTKVGDVVMSLCAEKLYRPEDDAKRIQNFLERWKRVGVRQGFAVHYQED